MKSFLQRRLSSGLGARGWGPQAGFMAALLGVGIVFHVLCWVYPGLFHALGAVSVRHHFVDMYAVLAANDASAAGLDVYKSIPFDWLGRPHVYGSWWLGLQHLGLTRFDTMWVSWVVILLFVVILQRQLRPASPRELVCYLLAVCSLPVLMAVERANNDLMIYEMLFVAVWLLQYPRGVSQVAGFLVIVLAIGLKFYPIMALLLIFESKDRRSFFIRAGCLVFLGLVLFPFLYRDSQRASSVMQLPYGILGFGSGSLAQVLKLNGKWFELFCCFAGIGAFCLGWWRCRVEAGRPAILDEKERWFIVGAGCLCFCFWLTINHHYRWILALFMLPHLWRQVEEGSWSLSVKRGQARLLFALILGIPWAFSLCCLLLNLGVPKTDTAVFFRLSDRLSLILQIPYWILFCLLTGCLARYVKLRWFWIFHSRQGASR